MPHPTRMFTLALRLAVSSHTGGRGTRRLLEKGHHAGGAEPTWEKRRHEKCPSSQLSPFPGSFSARSLLPLRSFGSSTTQTTVVGAEAAWADEPRCGPGLSLPLAAGTHPCRGGVGLLGFGVFLRTHAVRQQGDPGRDEASHRHRPRPAYLWAGSPAAQLTTPVRRGPSGPRWFKMWELPPLLLQQLGFGR